MSPFNIDRKKLKELRRGDIIRLYPYINEASKRYKRDYLLVIWGKTKYNSKLHAYKPLFALNMDGKSTKSN